MNKVLQQLMKLLRSQKEFWGPDSAAWDAALKKDLARMSPKNRILFQQAGTAKGRYNRPLGAGVLRKRKAKKLKEKRLSYKGLSYEERNMKEISEFIKELERQHDIRL